MEKVKRKFRKNAVIAAIATVAFLVLILVFYRMYYNEKKSNLIKDGEVTAQKSADLVDKYISTNMNEVALAAYALDGMITQRASDEEVLHYLVEQSKAMVTAVDEDSTGLYAYINGKFMSGTLWEPPEDFDATNRPWYLRPFETPGEVALLDPYHDLQSGHQMMAVGKVLCDGVSVVSMDMAVTGIQDIIDDTVSSGAADMVVVINDENMVIAHSDRSEVGRDYDVQRGSLGEMIVHNMASDEDTYFEFKYDKSDYMVYVVTTNSGLHCISVKNTSSVFKSMRGLLAVISIVVLLVILTINIIGNQYQGTRSDGVSSDEQERRAKEKAKPLKNYKVKKINLSPDDKKEHKFISLGTRIQRLVFIVLLVSVSLFCIASIIQTRAAIRSSVCQRMIDIANCAAGSINGDIYEKLTADDMGSPEYMEIYNALAVYRDNVELEYVYALKVEDDGRFTYTVDPSADEPEEFGDEIEYSEGLHQASLGIPSADDFRATDEWGTFYSSYSPIFDTKGKIVGIVGADFSVDWFEDQLNEQTNYIVIIYLIILFVTIAFAIILCYVWIKSITDPLGYMTEVAKRYGEGDFSEDIEIYTADEIGVLSHTLQTMSGSLQEQISRAEAANEAKSIFLANMSHEIRTPINTVLGMNEMILRESGDNTILYYAQNIKSAGKSLLNLINDILDFSKIEAGKTEITPVEYNLGVLLQDLLVLMQSRAYDKGLTLDVDFDSNIPKELYGDEGRIRQIITNILTNAVKYTKEGGIVFSVGYRKAEDDDSIYLSVKVSDTGMGIRKEDMGKLFSKFERLNEKSNRNIEGTGLGLSITKSLLELMGSTLEVESEFGKGSTFFFDLKQKVVDWEPMGDYRTSAAESSLATDKDRISFTAPLANILAVDDNPMNLVVFTNLIKHLKAQINTAGSADEGLSLTAKKKYDIIFFDHMMPEKDGIDALQELKSRPDDPNLETPAICLTANAISGAKEYYLSKGFNGYLSKPIDPAQLEKCLLTYLPKDKVEISDSMEDAEREPEQNAESEFIRELREQELLDVDAGIKNNGTAEAFECMVNMYVEAVDAKAADLDRLFGENRLSDYAIQIHALKSSSRIIGAMELGEAAQQLENASKAQDFDFVSGHHQEFIDRFLKLKMELSFLLDKLSEGGAAEEEKKPMDEELLSKVCNDMRSAAEDMDIDRLDEILKEMEKYIIPDDKQQLFETIREAVEAFDYGAISKALE